MERAHVPLYTTCLFDLTPVTRKHTVLFVSRFRNTNLENWKQEFYMIFSCSVHVYANR